MPLKSTGKLSYLLYRMPLASTCWQTIQRENNHAHGSLAVANGQFAETLIIRDDDAPCCGGELQHLIVRIAGAKL